jgi:hypothetical protein
MGNLVGESREQYAGTEFIGEIAARFGVLVGDITAVAQPAENRQRAPNAPPHLHMQDRENSKRRGEVAEAMFLTKMATMGFSVATPWGDSDKYDLIVDTGARLLRVQVKSSHRPSKYGGYHVPAHARGVSYRASDVDLLVAYVVPHDAWYVFPPRTFQNMKSMNLYPKFLRRKSKFEKYRDAWKFFDTCGSGLCGAGTPARRR